MTATFRRFDRAANRWLVMVLLAMCTAIFVALILGWTVEDLNVFAASLCGAGGLFVGWLGIAYFRQHLIADDAGVHVRNLVTSITVPWTEVDHFEHPVPLYSDGLRGHYGLRIVTRSGEVRFASLWAPSRVNRPGFAQQVVDELNRLKSEH